MLLFLGSWAGLQTAHAEDPSSLTPEGLNGGYFLFRHLCEEEDQLPLLLDIKHSPPEIKTFADQISQVAKASLSALDDMKKSDAALRDDQNPLPTFEQDVRESIKKEKQHLLLFGSTNSAFARALLVSQIEATTYAANIADVLAQNETSAKRGGVLRHLAAQWHAQQAQAYKLLGNY